MALRIFPTDPIVGEQALEFIKTLANNPRKGKDDLSFKLKPSFFKKLRAYKNKIKSTTSSKT